MNKFKPTKKTCPQCGKEFTQERRTQKYCHDCGKTRPHSSKRAGAKQRTCAPRSRTCKICGNTFETTARAGTICPRCKATPFLVEAHRLYSRLATISTHLMLRGVNYPPAIAIAQSEFEYYRDLTVRSNLAEQQRRGNADSERTQS